MLAQVVKRVAMLAQVVKKVVAQIKVMQVAAVQVRIQAALVQVQVGAPVRVQVLIGIFLSVFQIHVGLLWHN